MQKCLAVLAPGQVCGQCRQTLHAGIARIERPVHKLEERVASKCLHAPLIGPYNALAFRVPQPCRTLDLPQVLKTRLHFGGHIPRLLMDCWPSDSVPAAAAGPGTS